MLNYSLIPLCALLINAFTWIYVYAQKKKSKVNNAYLSGAIVLGGWLLTEVFLWSPLKEPFIIPLLKLQSSLWLLAGFWFLNFVFTFLKKKRNWVFVTYFISCLVMVIMNASTNLVIDGYTKYFWGVAEDPGIFYFPFIVFFTLIPFLYSMYLLLVKFRDTRNKNVRKQLLLLSSGTTLTLVIGMVWDAILPGVFGQYNYIRLSSAATVLQCTFIFLAVTRYRFLSISIKDAYMDLFNNINEGIVLLDKNGNVMQMNYIAREVLQVESDDTVNVELGSLIYDYKFKENYKSFETRIRNKGGELTVLISQSTVQNSKVELGKILIINDITEHTKAKLEKERFKHLSITDGLTSLYNHRYFYDYFEGELSGECPETSILFCDIDYFKKVNDYYGHVIGDIILREIGTLIKAEVGDGGLTFRYGGEEFVVLLQNQSKSEALKTAEKIRSKVKSTLFLESGSSNIPVTLSIGIAVYPEDALKIQELIDKADRAMYYAKQNGRDQCHVYSRDIDAIVTENFKNAANEELLIDSVYALAAAIDAKDFYTGKHSDLVAKYSLILSEELKMSEEDRRSLRIGALLHDCGKIGVPDNIINKPSKLSEDEWGIVKNHTLLGSDIVSHIIKTRDIKACIRNHHERWDGKGYPDGLKGEEIPVYSRIICIADAYHAMVSDRPYRKALTQEEAFAQLIENKGKQFDPALVDSFIDAMKKYDTA